MEPDAMRGTELREGGSDGPGELGFHFGDVRWWLVEDWIWS